STNKTFHALKIIKLVFAAKSDRLLVSDFEAASVDGTPSSYSTQLSSAAIWGSGTGATFTLSMENDDEIVIYSGNSNLIINNGAETTGYVVTIFNLIGQSVFETNTYLSQGINTIALNGVTPGFYIVMLQGPNTQINQKVLIK
ncbi:MAG: T9SS type A sorting domain-containing protein, partial [Marinilabiliaceae bacterium]|nr:T9SS type A sorting domain-containing protein [Marinilabiliaceae bacterium]